MRKIIGICLVILMLSACSYKLNTESGNNTKSNQFNIEETLVEIEIPLYKKDSLKLSNDNIFVLQAIKSDSKLYFYALTDSNKNLFYEYDISNDLCKQLDIEISGSIQSFDVAENSLFILVNEEDEYSENLKYICKKIDINTQDIKSIALDEAFYQQENTAITDFCVLNGQLYVNTAKNIYRFDGDGKMSAKIESENVWGGLLHFSKDDNLTLYNYNDNHFVIQEINSDLQFSDEYILNNKYNEIFPGLAYDQIFVADENYVYSLDLETGDKKPFVSRILYNLNISNFIPLSDASFFTVQSGIPTFWTPSTEDHVEQTSILKCATYEVSYELQSAVSLFNFHHEDIKIDMVDYSSYDDGMKKLMVELNAGKIPDILDLSAVPLSGLKSLGMLQNIEGYMSGKDLVPNILELLRSDDGIYEFVPGFQISTMATSQKYITSPNLNITALLDLAEKAHSAGKALFPQYITREDFISFVLAFSGDSFVNIDEDYCNFEDELFAKLIEFSSHLPSKNELSEELYTASIIGEYKTVLDDKQVISVIQTGNPVFELLKLKGLYGDTIEFIGFPTNAGNGIAMTPLLQIAMSSTSDFKDEIWTFFDYLLSEEYQLEMSKLNYLPVINEYLDEYIEHEVRDYRDEPLKLGVPLDGNTMTLECPLADDQTADDVWRLIFRIDCINHYDTTIYQIVLEECQPFFAGHKNISEVIESIQGRASLYVHERQ